MLQRKLFILAALCISLLISCKKTNPDLPPNKPVATKTIRFQLYTDKDFSTNEHTIIFTTSIETAATGHKLWDSTFAVRKIKDIPSAVNKIVIEKTIAASDSILKTGFYYTITDVGYSWYLDTVGKSSMFKVIDYDFQ